MENEESIGGCPGGRDPCIKGYFDDPMDIRACRAAGSGVCSRDCGIYLKPEYDDPIAEMKSHE